MYTQIRKKIHLKQGGKIPKFQNPWETIQLDKPITDVTTLSFDKIDTSTRGLYEASGFKVSPVVNVTMGNKNSPFGESTTAIYSDGYMKSVNSATELVTTNEKDPNDSQGEDSESEIGKAAGLIGAGKSIVNSLGKAIGKGGEVGAAGVSAGIDAFLNGDKKAGLAGTIGGAGVMAVNAVDQLAMGDKNFGSQSQAIDGAVHTVSGALMKSGNVWAIMAGAALEGVNFLTKAGGQTVQGFDVDIDSSGYGNIGHMESSSSRSWVSHRKLQDKLARRNEQVRSALAAAQISEDQKFESEARMNSVENTIMNNQIALAGGLQTNLLGS